ncbi:MAG: hypothetical protein NUV74_15565 [Candidatus Brocadiaceae bacterium]|nr:hypothetical protein [Candidatus Brocadiaceae bacterium]
MEKVQAEERLFMERIEKLNNSEDFKSFRNRSLQNKKGIGEKLLKNDFVTFRARFKEGLETYTELLKKPFGA